MTERSVILGTVGYMAPEQVRGQPSDHRADIFVFGAVLYKMVAARRAFAGDSAVETMNAILQADPPGPDAIGVTVRVFSRHSSLIITLARHDPLSTKARPTCGTLRAWNVTPTCVSLALDDRRA